MKTVLTVCAILIGVQGLRAQIPVTDVASIAHNEIAHIETMAKWVDSIAQLKTQIEQLKQQVSIQTDIRKWSGDPVLAANNVTLNNLRVSDLIRDYGHVRADIVSTTNSLASLDNTSSGTYRAIESTDLSGSPLVRDALAHRRYSVLDSQQQNYQQVISETKTREVALQMDLSSTLEALKTASTDAEVRKQTAKVEAINGQLAAISAVRREQADQVATQKIANDARLEQERLAAAELEAKDDYLANQRVTSFMQTLKVRQNTP